MHSFYPVKVQFPFFSHIFQWLTNISWNFTIKLYVLYSALIFHIFFFAPTHPSQYVKFVNVPYFGHMSIFYCTLYSVADTYYNFLAIAVWSDTFLILTRNVPLFCLLPYKLVFALFRCGMDLILLWYSYKQKIYSLIL